MRRLSGQLGSVLVIMAGYNDPSFGFGSAVDQVMAEAGRQGIPTVMWLSLRENVSSAFYGAEFRANNRTLYQKAIQYGPRLQIADWASYSANHPEWFYADGIHPRPSGAIAPARFIADQAARVLAGVIVTPPAGHGATFGTSVTDLDGGLRGGLRPCAPDVEGARRRPVAVPITDYVIQRSYNGGSWVS